MSIDMEFRTDIETLCRFITIFKSLKHLITVKSVSATVYYLSLY